MVKEKRRRSEMTHPYDTWISTLAGGLLMVLLLLVREHWRNIKDKRNQRR